MNIVKKPALSVVKTAVQGKQATRRRVRSTKAPRQLASRPVVLESDVYRDTQTGELDRVNGEIDLIDVSEERAEAEFRQRAAKLEAEHRAQMDSLVKRRCAESAAQLQRKADLIRIHDGCTAALNASEAPAEVATGPALIARQGQEVGSP